MSLSRVTSAWLNRLPDGDRKDIYFPVDAGLRPFLYMPYLQRRAWMYRTSLGDHPRFLYKFRSLTDDEASLDRLRYVVVRSRLYLSSPSDMNDPFDTTAKLVVEGSEADRAARFKRLGDKFSPHQSEAARQAVADNMARKSDAVLLQQLRHAHEDHVASLGIHCLAGTGRNVVMWSHYADQHRGVCLQFEPARDLGTFVSVTKMKYVPADDYPILNWIDDTAPQLSAMVVRKHESWAYEQEYRFIRASGAGLNLPFKPEALTGILIGCRAPLHVMNAVMRLLAERQAARLPSVRTYQASRHGSSFRITFHRHNIAGGAR